MTNTDWSDLKFVVDQLNHELTNFEVPSKIEIQLQFIVLLTKVRNVTRFCALVAFLRTFQNVFNINCYFKGKFIQYLITYLICRS